MGASPIQVRREGGGADGESLGNSTARLGSARPSVSFRSRGPLASRDPLVQYKQHRIDLVER